MLMLDDDGIAFGLGEALIFGVGVILAETFSPGSDPGPELAWRDGPGEGISLGSDTGLGWRLAVEGDGGFPVDPPSIRNEPEGHGPNFETVEDIPRY